MTIFLAHFNTQTILCQNNMNLDAEKWAVLGEAEIAFFMKELYGLKENITAIATGIIPKRNSVDDALNKFVDARSFFERGDDTMLNIIMGQFSSNGDKSCPLSMLKTMKTIFLNDYTVYAMNMRREVLLKIQSQREDIELQKHKETITNIVEEAVKTADDSSEIVNKITAELKHVSGVKAIRKALSYPVVEKELNAAIHKCDENTRCDDDLSIINSLVSAIVPFLKEGIHKEDVRVVDTYSSEEAKDQLLSALKTPIEYAIHRGLYFARIYDTFLVETLNNNTSLAERVVNNFALTYRKSITHLFFEHPLPSLDQISLTDYHLSILLNIVKLTGIGYQRHMQNDIRAKLNEYIGNAYPHWKFEDIKANRKLDKLIMKQCLNSTESELKYYLDSHTNFSNQDNLKFTEFMKEKLLKNYQDLNKEHISDKRFLQSLDENQFSHEERILYDRVHQFFKDIEEHANLYYGFRLGTFYLSSSYFRVLESIFPSTSSSTPDSIHSANNKEEL